MDPAFCLARRTQRACKGMYISSGHHTCEKREREGEGGERGGKRERERDRSRNDQSTRHCARCTCGPVFAEEKIDPLQKTVRHTKGPLFPRTRPIPPTSQDVAPFEIGLGFQIIGGGREAHVPTRTSTTQSHTRHTHSKRQEKNASV
jgi:hypothetical protein